MSASSPATKADITLLRKEIALFRGDTAEQFTTRDKKFDAFVKETAANFAETQQTILAMMQICQQQFDRIDARFDKVESKLDWTVDHIDAIEKRMDITDDERLVVGHQLQRMQAWAEKAAIKIQIPL